MARHAAHGHVSAFFWGQSYGGTQEVVAVAVLFALAGTHLVLMRAVPIAFSVAAALVLRQVGPAHLRRACGHRRRAAPLDLADLRRLEDGDLERLLRGRVALRRLDPSAHASPRRGADEHPGRAHGPCPRPLAVGVGPDARDRDPCARLAHGPEATGLAQGLAGDPRPRGRRPARGCSRTSATTGGRSRSRASGGTYESRFHGFVSATMPMALGLRVPYLIDWTLGSVVSVLPTGGAVGRTRGRRVAMAAQRAVAASVRNRCLSVSLRDQRHDLEHAGAALRRGADAGRDRRDRDRRDLAARAPRSSSRSRRCSRSSASSGGSTGTTLPRARMPTTTRSSACHPRSRSSTGQASTGPTRPTRSPTASPSTPASGSSSRRPT